MPGHLCGTNALSVVALMPLLSTTNAPTSLWHQYFEQGACLGISSCLWWCAACKQCRMLFTLWFGSRSAESCYTQILGKVSKLNMG